MEGGVFYLCRAQSVTQSLFFVVCQAGVNIVPDGPARVATLLAGALPPVPNIMRGLCRAGLGFLPRPGPV